MLELTTVLAFICACGALFSKKLKVGNSLMALCGLFILAPLLGKVSALFATAIICLICVFEIIAINGEVWSQHQFKVIKQPRMRLALISIWLTVGVTLTVWWWNQSNLSQITFNVGNVDIWRPLMAIIIILNLSIILIAKKRMKR